MASLLFSVVLVMSAGYFVSAKMELPPEMVEMLHNLQETCEQETGVDVALVDEAKKTATLKPDPKFKCFLKCMMVNMQVLSEDGVFDEETVMAALPDEIKAMGAQEIVHKCKGSKGADPCDTAFELVKCFAAASEEIAEVFT